MHGQNTPTAALLSRFLQIGTVTSVTAEPLAYTVQFSDSRQHATVKHGTQRAGDSRVFDAYSEGEQLLCAFPFGSDIGVAVCAIYQNAHPQPVSALTKTHRVFNDGAVIEYDADTHILKAVLPEQGIAHIKAPAEVRLETELVHCTQNLQVDGNVNVAGNVGAQGDVSDGTRSMAGDRGIYNGHKHPETGGQTLTPTSTQ